MEETKQIGLNGDLLNGKMNFLIREIVSICVRGRASTSVVARIKNG